jgi:hypothetical protein
LERYGRVEEWTIGLQVGLLWLVLGSLITVVGLIFFSVVYVSDRGGTLAVSLGGAEGYRPLTVVMAILLFIVLIHELIHGFVVRFFGGRPSYGADLAAKVMPYFYCTSPGHLFTRRQYVYVALAPAVVISTLGTLGVWTLPFGGWLVIPLGLHLGCCVGDIWVAGLTMSKSASSLIEDKRTGVRFLYQDEADELMDAAGAPWHRVLRFRVTCGDGPRFLRIRVRCLCGSGVRSRPRNGIGTASGAGYKPGCFLVRAPDASRSTVRWLCGGFDCADPARPGC